MAVGNFPFLIGPLHCFAYSSRLDSECLSEEMQGSAKFSSYFIGWNFFFYIYILVTDR